MIGGVTAVTADSRSLAEPRFTGLLASAPGALGDVRDILATASTRTASSSAASSSR